MQTHLPKAFPSQASLVPRFGAYRNATHPNHIAFQVSELIDGLPNISGWEVCVRMQTCNEYS